MDNTRSALIEVNRKLNMLISSTKRPVWVRSIWVKRLTGWDREILRQAYEDGIIETRINQAGIREFRADTIPEIFLINKKAQPVAASRAEI